MAGLQRDRIYELIVGDLESPNDSLSFTRHQIVFEVRKSSDSSKKSNRSKIQIFNLTEPQLKVMEGDYPALSLSVGYAGFEGLKRLLAGEITHVRTMKRGADRITEIVVSENYTGLNHAVLSTTAPPGSKVKDAIQAIRSGMAFGDKPAPGHQLTGTAIEKELLYGFPLQGSPKDMLNKLAMTYGFEWRVDGDTLFVNDADRAENENFANAKFISRETGLIENAYYESGFTNKAEKDPEKKNGVRFKMLLDASVVPGQIIQLEDRLIQGFFKVDEMACTGNYRDRNWFSDISCSALEKVVKK